MRINLSETDHLEISLISRGAANYIYDCNLLVSFTSRDKTYSQEVWVDGCEFKSFLTDLENLNKNLKGEAALHSDSPGEWLIKLLSVDSVGHLALQFEIGKEIWIGQETFWSKVMEAYPLDAEMLGEIFADFLDSFSEIKNA